MDILGNAIPEGLKLGLQPLSIACVLIGLVIGTIVGILPGIGVVTTMAVFLPFTLRFPPQYAILLFMGILVGNQWGNSIPAILMRVPGSGAAVLTAVEGYEFMRRGEGGKALGISLVSAAVGQFLSILFFVLAIVPLVQLAIRFMFPEMFALFILGLSAAAGLTGKSPVRGIISVAIGLAITTVGADPVTGYPRFDFGNEYLRGGIEVTAVIIGLLAVSELVSYARQNFSLPRAEKVKLSHILPTSWKAINEFRTGTIVGTIVGLIMGVLPGAGAAAASFIAYQQAKIFSKQKDQFGKGSPDAIAAIDSAQNACVGGDLVPTIALGVPGSASMIMILAALTMHGIIPGPALVRSYPPALYATVGGLLVSVIFLFPLGLVSIYSSLRIVNLSRSTVAASALVLCIVAVYSIRWAAFDVFILLGAGLLGYTMRRFGYPLAPAALAVVLGAPLEQNLRVGLVMTYGSWSAFLLRPAVATILLLAMITLMWPYISGWWTRRQGRRVAV